jgi:hypothetical protein
VTVDYRAWPIASTDLDDVPLEAMRFEAMIWQAMKRFGWYVTDRTPAEPDSIRHALRMVGLTTHAPGPVPPRTREDTGEYTRSGGPQDWGSVTFVPRAAQPQGEDDRVLCLVHLEPEPCPRCAAYIAAGL